MPLLQSNELREGQQFIWPDAFAPARERNYGQATIYYANYQP
jgi:hypothetical protein